MESWRLSLILAAVACSCCLVLCVFLICLCIMVKRIRRTLGDIRLRRGPTDSLEDPTECKQQKDEGNQTYSNKVRYTQYPPKRNSKHNSSIYAEPGEPVTILLRGVRPESGTDDGVISHLTPSQNRSAAETQASPEHVPLQFVNQGFHPETSRDSMVANQSEASDDLQPVLVNGTNEPIYQNTGELASSNNPDLERCHTMAIDKCS